MTTPTSPTTEAHGIRLKDLEAAGLSFDSEADGTVRARADRLVLRNLRLPTAAGVVTVARISLRGAQMRLAARPSGASVDVLSLSADDVQLESVELVLAQLPRTAATAGHDWRLDALGGLEGLLHIFIRDAAWVVDAEITMPIAGGRIDFDRVVVDHVGPNSAMGVGRHGVYVDAPSGARTELFRFTAADVPGAQYETRDGFGGRVSDRGSLDLRAFIQAWLDQGAAKPPGQAAGRDVERMLDRTKMNGELRLGDGVMGNGGHRLVLSGQAQGKNRLSVSAAVLGQRLVLRMPALCASGAEFELLGRRGRTGGVSATLEVHATGLSRPAGQSAADAGICVSVHHITVHQLALDEEQSRGLPLSVAARPQAESISAERPVDAASRAMEGQP